MSLSFSNLIDYQAKLHVPGIFPFPNPNPAI